MAKAVLFDLDGVLVDSEPFSREASDRILSEVDIVQTLEERKLVFGRRTIDNYRAAIEARGLKIDPQELVDRKLKLFANLIRGRLKPMPGVLKLLDDLSARGVRVAVVSSSPLDRVNVSLEESGLFSRFELVISGDCCRLGKPYPEPFLLAAERLGVKPGECVVIEDAEAGILAGKAAGMNVIGVRSPNTFGQDLSRADLIVDSLEDVDVKLIEGL